MRSISVNVCRFEELGDKAKRRAKDTHAAQFGYGRSDEAIDSLNELAKHFGGKLINYNIDFFGATHSSARFEMPEMTPDEIKTGLDELGQYDPESFAGMGECKLTGYCSDEDAIDGFRVAFMRDGIADIDALMESAFRSWLKACQADAEDEYTDSTFGDYCEANGLEFYEDGRIAK